MKHKRAMQMFNDCHKMCHKIYDHKAVPVGDIDKLEKNIKAFMHYYRETFPSSTVLPKMHMLEEHVVPFIRRWKIGFGLSGEQGAESIHKYFNIVARNCHSTVGPVEKLRRLTKEHLLHVAPANIALKPSPKKKKKS